MPFYPALSWLASRLTSITPGEMLRTDLCNRHTTRAPDHRSTPEPAACASATTSAWAQSFKSLSAIRSAASDHLSAIRPQVEKRLTTPLKLRANRSHSLLNSWEETSAGFRGATLPRLIRPRPRLAIRPLTLPVTPRFSP